MNQTNNQRSRLDLARQTASELLEELESGRIPVAQSLMRAKRLARLLRDEEAQRWLDLELKGYPQGFNFSTLGSCYRYTREGGRITDEEKYWPNSLPRIEAEVKAAEAGMNSYRMPAIDKPVKNYLESAATIQVVNSGQQHLVAWTQAYTSSSELFAAMRSSLHSYAADSLIALEFGDTAEEIFEEARQETDAFIRSRCPQAVQQLVAISERLRESQAESLSAALNSCRRVLVTVADSLFPSQDSDFVDRKGNSRKIGLNEYKNRLLAFIESKITHGSDLSIISSELEHLASRLDAVHDKVCKGVHVEVNLSEARLTVIHTYLFLAEVARHANNVALDEDY